jgi:hypothetical protein|tara:strand:- start:66 stop:509 length:444 start_codon:yes stop_codon:yes gene_type:complete
MLKSSYESLPEKHKIIFLAGLFDGEGSFGIWSKGKGRKKEFACTIEMIDKDTVQKFKDMFGGQCFPCKIRKPHHIPTHRWRMNGYRAFQIMDKMIEFMCIRRQEKYNVVKRDKISGTSRYAHLQKTSRDENVDGGCTNDARKKNGSR